MPWRCEACTVINYNDVFLACEMCNTPRSQAAPQDYRPPGPKPDAKAARQRVARPAAPSAPVSKSRGEDEAVVSETREKGELIDSVFGESDETRKLLEELITSEQTYVDLLRIVVTLFLQPLRAMAQEDEAKAILDTRSINTIFSNIQELMRINIELITSIEAQIGKEQDSMAIAKEKSSLDLTVAITTAFKKVIPYFKMYSVYVNNYPFAVEKLKECEQSNTRFAQFLAEASSHEVCKRLPLSAYLIMPVQRLCKYPLFFSRLLGLTNENNVSYNIIQDAANIVHDITTKVDLDKDRAQKSLRGFELGNMIQTIHLQRKLGQELHILEPGRHFLYEWEGVLHKTKAGNKKKPVLLKSQCKLRCMFLFSNLLIVCKKLKSYQSRIWIPLDQVKVKKLDATPVFDKHWTITVLHNYPTPQTRLSNVRIRVKNRSKKTNWRAYTFIVKDQKQQQFIYGLLDDSVRRWQEYCREQKPTKYNVIRSPGDDIRETKKVGSFSSEESQSTINSSSTTSLSTLATSTTQNTTTQQVPNENPFASPVYSVQSTTNHAPSHKETVAQVNTDQFQNTIHHNSRPPIYDGRPKVIEAINPTTQYNTTQRNTIQRNKGESKARRRRPQAPTLPQTKSEVNEHDLELVKKWFGDT